jgi:hypothetical protein
MGNPTKIKNLVGFSLRDGNLANFDDPLDANVLETHLLTHNVQKVKLGTGHYVLLANFHENALRPKETPDDQGVQVETIGPNDGRYVGTEQILEGRVFVQTVFQIRCPSVGDWVMMTAANGSWSASFDEKALLRKVAGAMNSPVPPNLLSTSFLDYKIDMTVTCKGERTDETERLHGAGISLSPDSTRPPPRRSRRRAARKSPD